MGAFHGRAVQQSNGGERHFRRHLSTQKVQRDGKRNRRGAEQERRVEKRHHFRRARADRYPRSAKSSGFEVSSSR